MNHKCSTLEMTGLPTKKTLISGMERFSLFRNKPGREVRCVQNGPTHDHHTWFSQPKSVSELQTEGHTNGHTDGHMDGHTEGQTHPLKEMGGRI